MALYFTLLHSPLHSSTLLHVPAHSFTLVHTPLRHVKCHGVSTTTKSQAVTEKGLTDFMSAAIPLYGTLLRAPSLFCTRSCTLLHAHPHASTTREVSRCFYDTFRCIVTPTTASPCLQPPRQEVQKKVALGVVTRYVNISLSNKLPPQKRNSITDASREI